MNKSLPDGYIPLEYLEIRAPRMFAVKGFPSKSAGEDRINELQQSLPSSYYQYHPYAQFLGMMPEYLIVLPENAIRFLNDSERRNLFPFVLNPPSRIKLHKDIGPNMVLYKFMKKEHIRKFFKKGELLLSTFERCNNLPDLNRRDPEGRFNITATHGSLTAVTDTGVGSNVILFSMSTTPDYDPPDGKVEEYALEIHDVHRFLELITQQLTKQGLRVMDILNGHCIYSGREIKAELRHPTIEKILEQSESGNTLDFGLFSSIAAETVTDESYFFKPFKNSYENEYRLMWFLDRKVDQDHYIVKLPQEARDLCRRINLKERNSKTT